MKILYRPNALSFRIILVLVISAFSLSCGGGAKVLKEPQQIETTRPLASAKNPEIAVDLDWIIVSNGPGSWAQNAYWDEYLISVHNPLSQSLAITEVAVFDSRGHRTLPLSNRKKLVKGSKETIRRYKDSDVDVHPGMGAGRLLATGGAVTVTGVGIVYAAASSVAPYGGASAGASGAAVVGLGMVIAGPVVAVAAIVRASNNSEVNEEIKTRHTKLPIAVDAASSLGLHLFFPIAVSPSHMVVSYEIRGRSYQLTIDTHRELTGLHLKTESNGSSESVREPQ